MPSASPKSYTWTTFGWWSMPRIFASAVNIRRNSGSSQFAGRIRFTTTVRSKPPGPEQVALNASAIPPTPSDLIRR